MYMPGRRRTASKPSSTVIELASYEEPPDFPPEEGPPPADEDGKSAFFKADILADLLFFSAIFSGFSIAEKALRRQWKTHGLKLIQVHLGVSPPSGRLFGYRGSQPRFLTFL